MPASPGMKYRHYAPGCEVKILTLPENIGQIDPHDEKLTDEQKQKLFAIACHYKCSVFGMEDLSFKKDNTAASRESNRKARNLWCRTLCEQLIEKRCNECGIELRKVNACYSSFIGNIQHNYVDATNASVEIGRRALLKFDKGTGLFPELRQEDMRTVEARFGPDAACGNADGWVRLYKSLMASTASWSSTTERGLHWMRLRLTGCIA